ncbi:hypothetical protein DSCW_43380 [Desulfosarcina widdelii]|uniref:Uncharacterized protein n=1 Tax=Desulfosarcina widdelii TaxID=947919 RepID=A0A5K7ZB38_9BACT|nr:hypothetical protein DSCW_43380 [Desulfosarcina widdelii]
MREASPIERAMFMLEQFEKEIRLMKAELAAYLPDDDRPVQNWITDPLTGKRRYIKRKGLG